MVYNFLLLKKAMFMCFKIDKGVYQIAIVLLFHWLHL